MKKQTPPIGAQINHPDAHFYKVGVTESGKHIMGLFQGLETAQIFRYSIQEFLHALRENALIDEYEESGKMLWIDDGTDDGLNLNAHLWVADFCDLENPELQRVLRDCAKAQLSEDITAYREALARFVGGHSAEYDDLPEYAGECIPALRNLLDLFLTHAEIYSNEESN